ncbi:serine--tRNA ligase [Candidatus Woesearchaeota archaeon]|nr:serine--tRNA ligase [Candidatus Woesearchaeota archaeon]
MLDLKFIQENSEIVKKNIKNKFQNEKLILVDEIISKYNQWKDVKKEIDNLRAKRNKISEEINKAKKEKNDFTSLLKQAKEIPELIKNLEEKSNMLQERINEILLVIPNIMHRSVPIGKDASQNKVLYKKGTIPKFKFKPKTHVELIESLDIGDFDASARVSGKGFYYLKKELALLNQALIRFVIDFMQKKKYFYIETPLMLNEKSIYASMDKKAIENSVYSIRDEDLNLIGTSEQSLLAMHSNQIIQESELPKKYFSYSMCFRKEIGAHGINEKGLWRTHQFNKIEQFIFCKPEDSYKYYNELLKNSEEIVKKLKLPYRVLEMCSDDLADWKAKSADIEVYRPTLNEYGEIMSLSNCTDYQARKLNIKLLRKNGEKEILHTLNNTALATSRALVAILENYQQKDGSIKIPVILQKYMFGIEKITRKK